MIDPGNPINPCYDPGDPVNRHDPINPGGSYWSDPVNPGGR
ncbi:hypothetical protein [Virgibacillus salexigens]|uniref:Uncharacterized protein n=1 Tax=Virgibacillus kapii TaxID=1638645 RepID=A0ABQ2D712_9BACI|nr:hypothetical protein [Virgibacillus kapii]GGJ48404.1 hypothetical protein GCM10007111_08090 [Virgibacillus kapii]